MSRYPVEHPEVDETLFVTECVIRVGCPKCKMPAGKPCKGARFDWLARGERRGFRYVQGAHLPRRILYTDWKNAGCPGRLPVSLTESYENCYGRFPRKIDRKTLVPVPPTLRKSNPKARAAKASLKRTKLPDWIIVEHRGCKWESLEGNPLWSWRPAEGAGDFTGYTVYEFMGEYTLSTRWATDRTQRYEHKCDSLEEAFDLAIELEAGRAFLDLLNARARWRIAELERRFGDRLESS